MLSVKVYGNGYTDAQALVDDPDVNAIYIATPPSAHATFAIMAMRAGKPCYIEKPLAASYEDCVRINRVSEQTGVPCFVAYYRRYLPYFKKVKEIVDSGELGKILTVQVRFAVPPRDLDYEKNVQLPWRLQSHISGGVISMTLLLISSTYYKTYLALLLRHMATQLIVRGSTTSRYGKCCLSF